MSGSFRARRPASPPLGLAHAHPPPPQQNHSQRFPQRREDHMDADERREMASLGFGPRGRARTIAPGGLSLTIGEWRLLLVVVVIAAGVRMFRLSRPNSVVFDEVHFGKFASKYIKTRYYVDVHPPLAKLLITLAAFVSGYDGNFDFKDIGKVYENVPYVAMRMVPATLGVAVIPLTYLTLRALECRATTALLGSLFITFENGLITQSRHILLDSPLIFFTALTTFLWVGFTNEDRHKPFTEQWWLWLTLTGLSLGAVVSCKWVGLFTIATVGFATLHQLWTLLGDLRVTPRLFMKHFMARALCLIVVPILFYMAMFEIHFLILENSGDGDGFMSSEFQHTLGGRGMQDTFADVAIGSTVTIRHVNTQGGYLHSHAHNFPTGSKQQQITLYPHRDANNNWLIINATSDNGDPSYDPEIGPLEYIRPFAQIKLQHLATDKRLHSHDFRPPVSDVDFQNEVSAYGAPGFAGDANDNWIVEIENGDRRDRESWKRLRTLRTHFRLRHTLQGCYLFSHKIKLPEWGFEQQEVTCNKNAVKANSLWYIETNTHPKLDDNAQKVNYRLPGFLSKFLELQAVMWRTNAGLTDRHIFDSRPTSWPRLRRGINFWVKDHRQIYLVGNPVVWWLSTLAVLAYAGVRGLLILRAQRGFRDFNNSKVVKYDALCGFLFMGWALHYFPFYLMSRQLFLHHYFPALYFAILLSCACFDLLTSSFRPRVRFYIAAVLLVVAIWTFAHFSPLAYGSPWTKAQCEKAKWLKTWDFSCNDFLDDYSSYTGIAVATPPKPSSVVIGGEEGGRAPIVVHDDNAGKAQQAPDSESTKAIGNQPQPGHDIFAEQPVKEIKSAAEIPDEPPTDVEEREVSTVMVNNAGQDTATTTSSSSSSSSTPPSTDIEKAHDDKKGENLSTEDTKTPAVDAENVGHGHAAKVKEGPLQHDDAEAEAARNDLYPDLD